MWRRSSLPLEGTKKSCSKHLGDRLHQLAVLQAPSIHRYQSPAAFEVGVRLQITQDSLQTDKLLIKLRGHVTHYIIVTKITFRIPWAKPRAKLNGKTATEASVFREELRICIFALSRSTGIAALARGVVSLGFISASGAPTAAAAPRSACRSPSRHGWQKKRCPKTAHHVAFCLSSLKAAGFQMRSFHSISGYKVKINQKC